MFTCLPPLGNVPKEDRESCYAARVVKGRRREISLGMLKKKGEEEIHGTIKKVNSEVNCRNISNSLDHSTFFFIETT
jgi:hypothetical protein